MQYNHPSFLGQNANFIVNNQAFAIPLSKLSESVLI